jgi:hypothetical protein
MIEVKDTWDAIKQLVPEVKTFVKSTDDGTIEDKAAVLSKANRIIDTKVRTVIIGYYKQEALSKILHL